MINLMHPGNGASAPRLEDVRRYAALVQRFAELARPPSD
jgi:hypothetical protein